MKKSAVFVALLGAACAGLYVVVQYLDLVGVIKRLHGM